MRLPEPEIAYSLHSPFAGAFSWRAVRLCLRPGLLTPTGDAGRVFFHPASFGPAPEFYAVTAPLRGGIVHFLEPAPDPTLPDASNELSPADAETNRQPEVLRPEHPEALPPESATSWGNPHPPDSATSWENPHRPDAPSPSNVPDAFYAPRWEGEHRSWAQRKALLVGADVWRSQGALSSSQSLIIDELADSYRVALLHDRHIDDLRKSQGLLEEHDRVQTRRLDAIESLSTSKDCPDSCKALISTAVSARDAVHDARYLELAGNCQALEDRIALLAAALEELRTLRTQPAPKPPAALPISCRPGAPGVQIRLLLDGENQARHTLVLGSGHSPRLHHHQLLKLVVRGDLLEATLFLQDAVTVYSSAQVALPVAVNAYSLATAGLEALHITAPSSNLLLNTW